MALFLDCTVELMTWMDVYNWMIRLPLTFHDVISCGEVRNKVCYGQSEWLYKTDKSPNESLVHRNKGGETVYNACLCNVMDIYGYC